LFHNAQRPGWVGSRVKNPDPVPSLLLANTRFCTAPIRTQRERSLTAANKVDNGD